MSEAVTHSRTRAEFFGFGSKTRQLFGGFHEAPRVSSGALLCPPFGQEAMRLHRLFRVLADRLTRHGVSALRFDYFGTGDSCGDDEDADFDGWIDDVRTAHSELVSRSGTTNIIWVGAGLGASLALSAAADAAPPPTRLVLWDPVLDGRAYLKALRIKHVELLEDVYSIPDPAWRKALMTDERAFSEEALGFGLPARLRQGIETITPDAMGLDLGCRVDVLADPANELSRQWIDRLRTPRKRLHALATDFEWTAEELRGAALVPSAALRTLLAVLQEP
jgi:pimeloyl-ACP methyl ester carboxylesterase